MISFRLNSDDVVMTMQANRKRFPGAVRRALNRAATSTRAYIASRVAKDLKIKSSLVKSRIKMNAATDTNLNARLHISGRGIPLIKFRAKGPVHVQGGGATGWRRGGGVTAKLPSGTRTYPHAFIVHLRGGKKKGVFERKGRKRLQIEEQRGPSMPEIFNLYAADGQRHGEESLRKNLASELRHAATVTVTGA